MSESPLFTAPILVVSQKAKLYEGSSQFSISDGTGTQIGAVQQVGQSAAGKVLKAVTNLDAMLPARFEILDSAGVQLVVNKARTFVKGRVTVERPDGTVIGGIEQKLRFGKAKFLLLVGDEQVGEIDAQNLRAWNFTIVDASGGQIATISKKWAGLAKEMFTNADNYVVEIDAAVVHPLRSLAVAAAVTIDSILKQQK